MARAGPRPVQLRHRTTLTSEQYVTQRAWRQARLDVCPRHPQGGCGIKRHGTYRRVQPSGVRVARWYCPEAHETFSLLPDCLASRLCGGLDDVEAAVIASENAGVERTAATMRVDEVELPGAVRWLRRRRIGIRAALLALMTAMPGRLGVVPTLSAVGTALHVERVLVTLREIAADHLHALPHPLGLRPRRAPGRQTERAAQHETGPDPPSQ